MLSQTLPSFNPSIASFCVPSSASTTMVDRISELPDELLCHILSLLPMKLAFTTTILSKRWTPLCYSLPVLRFDCGWELSLVRTQQELNDVFYRFCRFVDTLMLSPLSTNKPLNMFSLHCVLGNREQYSRILNAWFEAAKQRHVQEFHISLYKHSLNPVIFISRTLVVLKLRALYIEDDTSCVDLPSLKTLHLIYVDFKNHNDYIDFLSACPNLEDLHAEHGLFKECDRNNTSEGLKSLTLSKLVRASIDMLNIFSLPEWDYIVQLLSRAPKLEILSIKKWANPSSSKEWKCPPSVIECISSHLRSCTILNFQGSTNDIRFTKYILQNASRLQDMKLGIATDIMFLERGQFTAELFSNPRNTPGCKLSFEFRRFFI